MRKDTRKKVLANSSMRNVVEEFGDHILCEHQVCKKCNIGMGSITSMTCLPKWGAQVKCGGCFDE